SEDFRVDSGESGVLVAHGLDAETLQAEHEVNHHVVLGELSQLFHLGYGDRCHVSSSIGVPIESDVSYCHVWTFHTVTSDGTVGVMDRVQNPGMDYTEMAYFIGLRTNTLRQHVKRGKIPAPDLAEDRDLKWSIPKIVEMIDAGIFGDNVIAPPH